MSVCFSHIQLQMYILEFILSSLICLRCHFWYHYTTIKRQKGRDDRQVRSKSGRQAGWLTDSYKSSVCLHNYCAVKDSFDVIALDSPIPRHRSLSHWRHKKHIQSSFIIHPIQQSHLNTSSKQAVQSVRLSDLAVGRQETGGKTNRESLLTPRQSLHTDVWVHTLMHI